MGRSTIQTLARAIRGRAEEGRALPPAFSQLEALGAKLRYSQVALMVGAPGGGKSALALTWALRSQVPTLYFSADTDRMTMGVRLGAGLLAHETDAVEAALIGPEREKWLHYIDSHTSHMWFMWDPAPSLDDIEQEVMAYAAVNGQWPGLVVVDNLKNIWDDDGAGEADHVRYDRVVARLKEMSQEIGCATLVLHHVMGQYEDGYTQIPLSGILGKCAKDVRLAMTLHRGPIGTNEMRVSVVKNNGNKADPSGSLWAPLKFYPERMQFGE